MLRARHGDEGVGGFGCGGERRLKAVSGGSNMLAFLKNIREGGM